MHTITWSLVYFLNSEKLEWSNQEWANNENFDPDLDHEFRMIRVHLFHGSRKF